jgi:hypothetical protein
MRTLSRWDTPSADDKRAAEQMQPVYDLCQLLAENMRVILQELGCSSEKVLKREKNGIIFYFVVNAKLPDGTPFQLQITPMEHIFRSRNEVQLALGINFNENLANMFMTYGNDLDVLTEQANGMLQQFVSENSAVAR